jgi:hypothetical protein
VSDQFPVGCSCGIEILAAFLTLTGEVDDLLFDVGDAVLELIDVAGYAEAGLAPGLLTQQFGELLLTTGCGWPAA